MISVITYPSCDPCRERKIYETATRNTIGGEFEIEQPPFRRLCCHEQQCHQLQKYRDWANIGADMLEYILKKLPLADMLHCRAVCRWWRSVTKTHLSITLNCLPKPYPPLIILDIETKGLCFLDVLRNDNLYFPNTKSQELLEKMIFCTGYSSKSYGGYFLMLNGEGGNDTLYLFHPLLLSGSALRLPHISVPCGAKHGILKAALWGDPVSHSGSCYGLVVLHHSYGAPLFAKCGDTQFTPLYCGETQISLGDSDFDSDSSVESGEDEDDEDEDDDDPINVIEILCVGNYIYGLTSPSGYLLVWDCTGIGSSSSGVPRLILEFNMTSPCWGNLSLVESQGEILLVGLGNPKRRRIEAESRGIDINTYNKTHPMGEVYKMDFNKKEWVRIYSLGDRVLFVMELLSMSVSSHEFPDYQRNSIYYWDISPLRGTEASVGVFNMEDGSIKFIRAKM